MADADPAERCPECGGSWLDGRIAVPIVGGLRFVYRLSTNEVATEVTARMCGDCGRVQLRVKDPGVIRTADEARKKGRAGARWRFPPKSGAHA